MSKKVGLGAIGCKFVLAAYGAAPTRQALFRKSEVAGGARQLGAGFVAESVSDPFKAITVAVA